ncbi:DUF3291 domain-containing protein [Hamadaea tsunoensis]|uniref:DUF3291 domain-containing protein n=1 Tax=Hamadaea tsunoensis TaxID=53368 RepID=UPI0004100CA7|nr:DUF3291 domain-containing protein [Hamadaea tsunoensis]
MHLAQLNVGRLVAPLGSPEVEGFAALLGPVNALADAAPGFVWRLQESDNDPGQARAYAFDPTLLINLSVWRTRDDLWNYVYRAEHQAALRRRREWFRTAAEPSSVLWWIPEGHRPSVREGMARLTRLRETGSSPEAFTFQEFHER